VSTGRRTIFKREQNREEEKKSSFKQRLLVIYKLFSILDMIIEYDFKNRFIIDLISGITVGIMHIPQGLAYGSLASLTPIFGIYFNTQRLSLKLF
jgi:hypothetical protein